MTIGPRPRRENDPRRQVGRDMFGSDYRHYRNGPSSYESDDDGYERRDSDMYPSEVRWDEEEQDPNWGRKYRRD